MQPPNPELERLARRHVARSKPRTERSQVERECGMLVRGPRRPPAHTLHEDRVGRADLHADASDEGEVRGVEVVGAPAEEEGV